MKLKDFTNKKQNLRLDSGVGFSNAPNALESGPTLSRRGGVSNTRLSVFNTQMSVSNTCLGVFNTRWGGVAINKACPPHPV